MAAWARSRTQRIEKARSLIRGGIGPQAGVWADLGCGDGIFTSALAGLVGPGSRIFAVDRNPHALQALRRNFDREHPALDYQAVESDFTASLGLPPLDGVLLANALHFSCDKAAVLRNLAPVLKPGGSIIVVEYNTSRGNPAVPYPLSETGFLELVDDLSLERGRILARIPSRFLREMYAGLARRPVVWTGEAAQ